MLVDLNSESKKNYGGNMEILYKVHDNLYVNLTNKCPCSCTFCLRQTMDRVGESDSLWLDREPEYEEVVDCFEGFDMTQYKELVFCGFGEPTEALDVLVRVAAYAKKTFNIPIRLNTNGLGNLVNNRDIVPELAGLIDTVSISLNNPDPVRYNELVRSRFGEGAFQAMLDFAASCVGVIPNVVLTTVDTTISKEDEKKCQRICDEIGATYRIRPYED